MPSSIMDKRLINYFQVLLKRVWIKIGQANPRPAIKDLNFKKDVPLFKELELQVK
jgi:hypothetical protein